MNPGELKTTLIILFLGDMIDWHMEIITCFGSFGQDLLHAMRNCCNLGSVLMDARYTSSSSVD